MIDPLLLFEEILWVQNTPYIPYMYVSFVLAFTNEYLKAFLGADFGTLGGYFASFSPCLPDTGMGLGCWSQWDGNQAE